MSDIPADVLEMARRVATGIAGLVANNADARLVETDGALGIATALLAERERCASPPVAEGEAQPVAVIVAAMKQSFRDVVAGSANKLFEDTGVSMPADHVWERYARAALAALSSESPAPAVGEAVAKPNEEKP